MQRSAQSMIKDYLANVSEGSTTSPADIGVMQIAAIYVIAEALIEVADAIKGVRK